MPLDGDDYKVGYGKPPVETQFKPGQSGNPSGRPKRKRYTRVEYEDAATTEVTTKEDGQPKRMSRREAVFTRLFALAANGDVRAIQMVLDLEKEAGRLDPLLMSQTAKGGYEAG